MQLQRCKSFRCKHIVAMPCISFVKKGKERGDPASWTGKNAIPTYSGSIRKYRMHRNGDSDPSLSYLLRGLTRR